jgi:hypothetical protein
VPVTQLDPYLIRSAAADGMSATWPDAIDLLIAKINELVAGGGGSSTHIVYTCSGAEGTTIPIVFADVRDTATYVVQLTHGGPAANPFQSYRPLHSSFATTGFNIEAAAGAVAGDIIMISVSDES